MQVEEFIDIFSVVFFLYIFIRLCISYLSIFDGARTERTPINLTKVILFPVKNVQMHCPLLNRYLLLPFGRIRQIGEAIRAAFVWLVQLHYFHRTVLVDVRMLAPYCARNNTSATTTTTKKEKKKKRETMNSICDLCSLLIARCSLLINCLP